MCDPRLRSGRSSALSFQSSTRSWRSDKTAPPKQRHTAKRIFERLRIEHGYAGGYTGVKDYVRIARPIEVHSENYSEPFGDHIGEHGLCYRCHQMIHNRFRHAETWAIY